MTLLRRRLRCHGCNEPSRDSFSQVPRQYRCPSCNAVNYYDERGNITDPPAEIIATAPALSFHHFSRSPSPVMSAPDEPHFCDTCVRNQYIVQNMVANYLPDEEDPEYEKLAAAYDEWRAEIEEWYPQVCKECTERVNDQIRNAGYAAKADHLRRLMEKSEEKRRVVPTSRQTWTLRLISLAKWTYILSLLIQAVWHIFGCMVALSEGIWEDELSSRFDWKTCLRQAVYVRSVDQDCVISPLATKIVFYALVADGLTIWWNPRLKDKTNSIAGRMRGLKSLWAVRSAAFIARGLSLYFLGYAVADGEASQHSQYIHAFMLLVLLVSAPLTWRSIHFIYHTPIALQRAAEQQSSAPGSARKSRVRTHRVTNSQATPFDDMAQGFTSSFLDEQNTPAFPPSPTLSASSYSTHTTEATTPYSTRSIRGDDDMDWTPTQRRFAQQQPTIHPSPWADSQPASPPRQTPSHEPHSLFRVPDSNPFRHRVPAAPKAPAEAKADPWRRSTWAPPLKEATPNFFKEGQKDRGGVGEMKGLDGVGVPKNVKRDAELFASPKLKYDNYGTMKDTGLEDTFESTFNNFFAK